MRFKTAQSYNAPQARVITVNLDTLFLITHAISNKIIVQLDTTGAIKPVNSLMKTVYSKKQVIARNAFGASS